MKKSYLYNGDLKKTFTNYIKKFNLLLNYQYIAHYKFNLKIVMYQTCHPTTTLLVRVRELIKNVYEKSINKKSLGNQL